MGPLISVVIPVYNVERYLEECLDSVLNQTYKNIEIIAINDGSTDDSLKILRKYESKYKNIKMFSQENLGQSAARNKGIEAATGKYIYFLDADDYILPETFEILIEKMEKNNLDLIRFKAEPFVDKIDIKLNKKKYDFDNFFDKNKVYNHQEFLDISLQTFSPSPVLYIVKTEILLANEILFKPGIIHEDDLFSLEVFLNVNSVMYQPNSYYKRRYRANSTMTNQSLEWRKKSFASKCIILEELNHLLEKYINRQEIKLIKKRIRSTTATLIYNYQDLDKTYRNEKLKKIDNLSLTLFLYYTVRRSLKECILTIKKWFT